MLQIAAMRFLRAIKEPRACLGVLSFALIAISISAPPALGTEEPAPIEMALYPRSIEGAVRKYPLFPAEAELKPGNAVPILLRLPWEQTPWMNQVFPTLRDWESRPLDAPEWAASDGVLPKRFWNEMKRAAFRRHASWEYPIGEEPLNFILLPDVQGLRGFLGYGLSARIRYHISRGEFDTAREGILIGLANGRHLAQTPFAVNQLVALAIHRLMLNCTAELISQRDSPNLYWGLSTLPDSLIELYRAASLESDAFAMSFPAVNDLDTPRDAAEWKKMADQLLEFLEETDDIRKEIPVPPYIRQWADLGRVEFGDTFSEEKLAKMSAEEAAVRWYVRHRQTIEQHSAAMLVLPPREAWPLLRQLRKELALFGEKTGMKDSGISADKLYVAAWSLKRKIASLRIIEAVRDHLASHDGKLPTKLDEMRGVPIPLDPMTGEPFHWHSNGATATLKAPSLAIVLLEPDWAATLANTLEYRLEVQQTP